MKLATASVVVLLIGTTSAKGHTLGNKSQATDLASQLDFYKGNVKHARAVLNRYTYKHFLLLTPKTVYHSHLLNYSLNKVQLIKEKMAQRICAGLPCWLYNAFICIHGGEGSWNSNTGNGYYGGLQMDLTFQSKYGSEFLLLLGTANNWTPRDQIRVAARAFFRGRGFYPWPNTARRCGLI